MARWLLDLDVIPPDAEGVRLAFEHPLPAWLVALLLAAFAGLGVWTYTRLTAGSTRSRMLLGGVRAALLAWLLALVCGPMLEQPREQVEEDWVLVLVDRSASLSIPDVDAEAGGDARRTRDAQLQSVIAEHESVWRTLDERRKLVWLGFHAGAFGLDDAADPTKDAAGVGADEFVVPGLGEASGRRTQLRTALEQALQRAAARPVSGIVVLSDGRTEEPPDQSFLRRLAADRVPVFTVPLGSPEAIGDVAVRRVEAPRRAFVRDKVPVEIELGEAWGAGEPQALTVRLVDTLSGEVLDEQTVDPASAPDESERRVTLTAEPSLEGESTWRVEVETARPDLIPQNNARSLLIELVDRPLRVLFVEGYPRWEYRYVKNLLIREASIDSSVMLLSADRDFAQEGNQPITRLPRSAEEFAEFDVVILGDVPSSFFSPDQLEVMRDHIARRGAGMLWIGGERSTPVSYAGTVLSDLLPMRASSSISALGMAVNMRPTELARRLGVLQLTGMGRPAGWPDALENPGYGWSQLYYVQRIDADELKPTAEVLAETVQTENGRAFPIVVNMRYGAGQSIYVATDEIWRWRYGRGELLFEQFWLQMIRMLGRESLAAGGGGDVVLDVQPRQVRLGRQARVEARVRDASLEERDLRTLEVRVTGPDNVAAGSVTLRRDDAEPERFVGAFEGDETGRHRLRIDDPAVPDVRAEAEVEVYAADDELRRPETDHDLLRTIAAETGGSVLAPDELDRLARRDVLPDRSLRTDDSIRESIWDSPLALLVALLLLGGEWIGRKLVRLV